MTDTKLAQITGNMSSLMQGLLVPMCTYSIVAIGLNLCVGCDHSLYNYVNYNDHSKCNDMIFCTFFHCFQI